MDDVYNTFGDYKPKRYRKILIVFDDVIANNKRFQSIVKGYLRY